MVQKCGYLPSAISRLGKILSSKISLGDWRMINDRVSEYVEGDEQLVSGLDSKYDDLPYHLKQCFLYLGNFSKEKEIDVEDLYFQWIAEDMVSSINGVSKNKTPCVAEKESGEGEMTVEESVSEDRTRGYETILEKTPDIANEDGEEPAMNRAEKYLTELASRGVVKVQRDELSRSQPCFLFSPVQELLSWEEEKKAMSLQIVDCCNGKHGSSPFPVVVRRVAVHFDQQLSKFDLIFLRHEHRLRSVFLLNTGKKSVELPLKTTDLGKFKLLRILNFVRCKFDGKKLPEGIDRLLNLRYLGLLYCDLDELPLSIGNLRNLRVLNVRVLENYHLRIPDALCKLVLLTQLRLPYWTDRTPTPKLMLRGLLELETLFGFNSLIHDLDSLSELKKLRHLGAHAYCIDSLKLLIKFITHHGARMRTNLFIENTCCFTSEEEVKVLRDLLMCPNLHELTLSMALMKLPDCGPCISSGLTQLKLIECWIKEDPMEVLGKFPNLQKLCLGNGAFLGSEMTVQANGFPNLTYLEIRNLPHFEEWKLGEGAMRSLSDLIIRRCPRLKMIPDGLKSISNLKNLEIELAPEAFEDVSEEYGQKFNFVTSLNIRKVETCSTS